MLKPRQADSLWLFFTYLALLQQFLAEFQNRGHSSASGSHLRTQRLVGEIEEESKEKEGKSANEANIQIVNIKTETQQWSLMILMILRSWKHVSFSVLGVAW